MIVKLLAQQVALLIREEEHAPGQPDCATD